MILYGAGGHAKVVASAIDKIKCCFVDSIEKNTLNGIEMRTYSEDDFETELLVIAIGDNAARCRIAMKVKHSFGTVIHESVRCDTSVTIGEGSQVLHGAIIQAGTTIGKHTIVNTGASIDHDGVIGDFCHIAPQVTLCGNVTVGNGTLIGAGAVVIPGITIGENCVIGAGSVVTKDIASGCTAVGNPARIIKRNEG